MDYFVDDSPKLRVKLFCDAHGAHATVQIIPMCYRLGLALGRMLWYLVVSNQHHRLTREKEGNVQENSIVEPLTKQLNSSRFRFTAQIVQTAYTACYRVGNRAAVRCGVHVEGKINEPPIPSMSSASTCYGGLEVGGRCVFV